MYNLSPNPIRPAQHEGTGVVLGSSLAYLRKVYSLFGGGILFAIAGALVALYAGAPTVVGARGGESIALPPIVAFNVEHFFISMAIFIGAFFGARALRHSPGINVAALFGYTFITGLFIAPSLFFAQLMASQGATLDPSPIRDAFLLTGAAFTGLTGYVFITKKDFSFLGASLSMGIWVLLGAMVLGFFLNSAALQLAIASVGVLLFSGYILYDTSRILRSEGPREAVSDALGLFLDVVNLFLFLLRILSSARNR
ncbi:MAG: Bax inhibitor-1/YccA family protein [Polyangiaceae bacterium]